MHPLLRESIQKARASLKTPPSKKAARRRLLRYEDLAATAHPRSPTGAIARGEASRLREYLSSKKWGRNQTEGRETQEEIRHGLRQNEKHKPKPKKRRRRAVKKPAALDVQQLSAIGARKHTGRQKLDMEALDSVKDAHTASGKHMTRLNFLRRGKGMAR